MSPQIRFGVTPEVAYLYPPYDHPSSSSFVIRNSSKSPEVVFKLKYHKNSKMKVKVSQPHGCLEPGEKRGIEVTLMPGFDPLTQGDDGFEVLLMVARADRACEHDKWWVTMPEESIDLYKVEFVMYNEEGRRFLPLEQFPIPADQITFNAWTANDPDPTVENFQQGNIEIQQHMPATPQRDIESSFFKSDTTLHSSSPKKRIYDSRIRDAQLRQRQEQSFGRISPIPVDSGHADESAILGADYLERKEYMEGFVAKMDGLMTQLSTQYDKYLREREKTDALFKQAFESMKVAQTIVKHCQESSGSH